MGSHIYDLEAFRTDPNRFDVVITDQTMPQMTGEDLIHALHRLRPELPVILCTGFSHVMDAKKAQALGQVTFPMKPVDVAAQKHNHVRAKNIAVLSSH